MNENVTSQTNITSFVTSIVQITGVDKGVYCYKIYLSYILRWNPEWLDEIGIILRIFIRKYVGIIRQI